MAQNITLLGASYSAVPAVQLPKTGGGTARFDDATVTTATASDVATGKVFLASDGTITTGTNSGSTPTIDSLEVTPTTSQQTFNSSDVDGYKPVVVNAMPSGTATAPTTISGSQATLTTGTNTITLQKTLSVTPRVTTAGYVSAGTAGNALVSLNTNVTTKAATTFHPSTSDQSIASGTYTTGAQTIKAVTTSNLTADNIKNGVTITIGDSTDADCVASVTGTYEGGGGGGSSNIVEGTFTTGSSAGAGSVSLSYTGTGYPIAAMVFIASGAYNSANSDWYNSVQRYAVGQWAMSKSVQTSAPTYTTSGSQNQGVTCAIYKNSTSTATTYTRTSAMNTNVYSSSNASNAAATCVRLKSGNVLSYYVNTSSYGLLPNMEYKYIVIYSS